MKQARVGWGSGARLFTVGIAAASIASASAFAVVDAAHAANRRPKIESVVGAPGVKTALLQKGLELREAAIGEEIQPGEHVRTDEKTRVLVVYPDGSRLTVLPGTDVAIGESKDGAQDNDLRSGRVQGEVVKTAAGIPNDASGKKPIKFVIRTKAATMGVRGTEFVAAADAVSGLSQFHTLEGAVEVASSPGSLLGGQGVPVLSGNMVSATETGLGAVQSFNRVELLNSLSQPFGSAASAAGAGASAASAAANAAAAAAAGPRGAENAPPPKLPEPPKAVEPPPAVAEARKAEAEAEKPQLHLLAFNVGFLFGQHPEQRGQGPLRLLSIAWAPFIPVPLPVIQPYVRGSFGVHGARNGSLYNDLLIREFVAYAGTHMLNPLFAEIGGGNQTWIHPSITSAVFTANVGFVLSQNGRWNRVYAGFSRFFGAENSDQLRVGLGIQF